MNRRALTLGNDLNTLCGGICPLVILSGEKLHGKHLRIGFRKVFKSLIQLRFGKDRVNRLIKEFFVNVFNIVFST